LAIEQGTVIRLGDRPESAWVMTTRSSGCEACASRDSCGTAAKSASHEVEAINPVGAQAGDRIQMLISTSSLLKATFLLYVFPILCMLFGAVAGHWSAIGAGLNPSVMAALGAFAFFVAAMVVVRTHGRRLGRNNAYRPQIIRILGPATRSRIEPGHPNECREKHHRPVAQMGNTGNG
jgi:sigma-E factor negative regulatory protein RseC